MNEIDTLISEVILQHGQTPYDPVKAREYYLRTRKLKGRRSSGQLDSDLTTRPRVTPKPVNKQVKFTPEQKKRGERFKNRADEIRIELDEIMDELRDINNSNLSPDQKNARKQALAPSKVKLQARLKELRSEFKKDPAFYSQYINVGSFQRKMRAANSRSSSDKKRMTN